MNQVQRIAAAAGDKSLLPNNNNNCPASASQGKDWRVGGVLCAF